jgi:GT2 family glycosyltransferase
MKDDNYNKLFSNSKEYSSILIIVLNWNELELTLRCIRSLIAQEKTNPDILIVDNNSDVDPSERIISEFPNIKVIRNKENYGVAGGRNTGIRFAINNNYKYILMFDNDAYADSRMLTNLLSAAKLNPNASIFGPKIFIDGKTNVIWRAGCTSWKWTYLHAGFEILKRIFRMINKPLPSFVDTMRGEYQIDTGQYDEECDLDFQIGCAQFIRTGLFSKVGLLDEEFSPYGAEDIEFCARSTQAGFRIRYVPEAICWHRVGSSFREKYNRTYYQSRHFILLARKRLTLIYFWLLFVPDFILLTIPLMLLQTFIRKESKSRKAFIDALLWHFNDIKERGILLTKTR